MPSENYVPPPMIGVEWGGSERGGPLGFKKMIGVFWEKWFTLAKVTVTWIKGSVAIFIAQIQSTFLPVLFHFAVHDLSPSASAVHHV